MLFTISDRIMLQTKYLLILQQFWDLIFLKISEHKSFICRSLLANALITEDIFAYFKSLDFSLD